MKTLLWVGLGVGVLYWLDRQAQLAANRLTPAGQIDQFAGALNSTANTISGIIGKYAGSATQDVSRAQ